MEEGSRNNYQDFQYRESLDYNTKEEEYNYESEESEYLDDPLKTPDILSDYSDEESLNNYSGVTAKELLHRIKNLSSSEDNVPQYIKNKPISKFSEDNNHSYNDQLSKYIASLSIDSNISKNLKSFKAVIILTTSSSLSHLGPFNITSNEYNLLEHELLLYSNTAQAIKYGIAPIHLYKDANDRRILSKITRKKELASEFDPCYSNLLTFQFTLCRYSEFNNTTTTTSSDQNSTQNLILDISTFVDILTDKFDPHQTFHIGHGILPITKKIIKRLANC